MRHLAPTRPQPEPGFTPQRRTEPAQALGHGQDVPVARDRQALAFGLEQRDLVHCTIAAVKAGQTNHISVQTLTMARVKDSSVTRLLTPVIRQKQWEQSAASRVTYDPSPGSSSGRPAMGVGWDNSARAAHERRTSDMVNKYRMQYLRGQTNAFVFGGTR